MSDLGTGIARRAVDAVELDASWGIAGKLHGGYLLAVAVQAAMRHVPAPDHPHPLAVSAMYVAAPSPGSAEVVTTPQRSGKTVSTSAISLEQDGRPCVLIHLTAGRLPEPDTAPAWESADAAPPQTAPIPECQGPRPLDPADPGSLPGHLHHVDMVLDPASAPYLTGGQPRRRGDFRGWLRYPEAEFDPLVAQLILADALPPVTLDLGLSGWVPTLQLQVILRRVPTPGWQQGRQVSVDVSGGLVDEDCTLWDITGRVTVQARQLAGVRIPA